MFIMKTSQGTCSQLFSHILFTILLYRKSRNENIKLFWHDRKCAFSTRSFQTHWHAHAAIHTGHSSICSRWWGNMFWKKYTDLGKLLSFVVDSICVATRQYNDASRSHDHLPTPARTNVTRRSISNHNIYFSHSDWYSIGFIRVWYRTSGTETSLRPNDATPIVQPPKTLLNPSSEGTRI